MKRTDIKLFVLIILSFMMHSVAQAFDMNEAVQIMEEEQQYQTEQQTKQQDIREMRLREWQAKQQQAVAPTVQQQQQYNDRQRLPEPEADDLFAAATNGNAAQIGRLLSQGLDVNTPNREKETALHMAAARGHYSTVIFLINNGAYVNARTVKGWLPLHHAVRFRHPNIVNFLVQRGSSPGVRTSDGLSAIDMARMTSNYRILSILGAR